MPSVVMARKGPIVRNRQLNFDVPELLYERLAAAAKALSLSPSRYAMMLFQAAWTARQGETGDRDLDMSVARVALLSSMEIDTDEIARYTGIPESTVVRVLDAWRKEIGLPARARA